MTHKKHHKRAKTTGSTTYDCHQVVGLSHAPDCSIFLIRNITHRKLKKDLHIVTMATIANASIDAKYRVTLLVYFSDHLSVLVYCCDSRLQL